MKIQENIELQPYNSFRTKAKARYFIQLQTIQDLTEALRMHTDTKKLIIGNGCNIFFTKDFDGLVIKPDLHGFETVDETEQYIDIEAQAGEDWDNFVEYAVASNYAGIETMSLIPSSVGAAPIQNIGAYGTELKDVCLRVQAIDLETLEASAFTNEMCQFAYRNSIFKQTQRYIITSVVFRLKKSFSYKEKYVDLSNELRDIPNPTLQQVRDAVIRIRTRKLPDYKTLPNAGSFFKNPIISHLQKEQLLTVLPDAPLYPVAKGEQLFKTSAAYLIDSAGWKGRRVGNVGTYERQPLIIVNYGTENGQEIVDFMRKIQTDVHDKFNITLEPEVWIF